MLTSLTANLIYIYKYCNLNQHLGKKQPNYPRLWAKEALPLQAAKEMPEITA